MKKQTNNSPTILSRTVPPADHYLLPKHAAEYLGLTKAELLQLTARQEIPHVKMVGRRYFNVQALDAYIAERQAVCEERNDRRAKSLFVRMKCAPNCDVPRLDELDENMSLEIVSAALLHFASDFKKQSGAKVRKELRAAAINCLSSFGLKSAEKLLDAALRVNIEDPDGQADYLRTQEAAFEKYTEDMLRKLSAEDVIHLCLTGTTLNGEPMHKTPQTRRLLRRRPQLTLVAQGEGASS